MQQSSAVFVLFSLSIIYLGWVYLNALFDPAIDLNSLNLTISTVSDDSERQLVVLIIVLLISFVTSTLLFESGKYNNSNLVPILGLFFVVFLYATILVRLTYSPTIHYLLAGGTFLFMLLLSVAMSPHTANPFLSYCLSALAMLSFVPVALSGLSSKWIATAEFVSIVVFVFIIYMFFDKK